MPGSFTYTPAAGTVLKAGTQTLTAVFTPNNTKTYSAATATVQLTVDQASPVITWAPLAAISRALPSAQPSWMPRRMCPAPSPTVRPWAPFLRWAHNR